MLQLLTPALVGSLLLAVLSTAADYVWFLDIPQHQVLSGSIHGAVLFAALGLYLGWRKGKAAVGLIGGLLSGVMAALSFYALAPIGGYNMMLVSWLLLWIMLAGLQTYLDGRLNVPKALARGVVTAVAAARLVDGLPARTVRFAQKVAPPSPSALTPQVLRPQASVVTGCLCSSST
jgi:hypothetical protein